MSKVIPATSKDVRTFFASHPTLVPSGAEKSVQVSCKGRIKPTAIKVYNKHNKTQPYSEGNRPTMPLTYKAGNHRMVTEHLPVPEVRAWAGKAGTRGPLSEDDISFAAEVYAEHKRAAAKVRK